jgi:hypothetical protein
MHFVAMLAFIMPTPMSYDIGLTALSLVVAIFVTGGGFYVISRQSASPLRLGFGGIFMGLALPPCTTPAWRQCGGTSNSATTRCSLCSRCS